MLLEFKTMFWNKRLTKQRRLTWLLVTVIIVLGVIFGIRLAWYNWPVGDEPTLGATFSTFFASDIGLDPVSSFRDLNENFDFEYYRIPVYWQEAESVRGEYDFSQTDSLLEIAAEFDRKVVLVIGRKVPRWPECHIPSWATELDQDEQNKALLEYIEVAVNHFKDNAVIDRWQVENEPFLFFFGECPTPDYKLFSQEIELVHSLDSRSIMVTESGELSTWVDAAIPADILGISMYRLVWNDFFGWFYWPLTPGVYRAKSKIVQPLVDRVVISELQSEPWFTKPISEIPIDDQFEAFGLGELESNLDFARRTGFSEVYLWGVEWWAYMRDHGDTRMWDGARLLIND